MSDIKSFVKWLEREANKGNLLCQTLELFMLLFLASLMIFGFLLFMVLTILTYGAPLVLIFVSSFFYWKLKVMGNE